MGTRMIPNFLTCLNLLCGCFACMQALNGNLENAGWMIFASAVLDFGDGLAARILGAHSTFGKELDSLADVVSFGLVPGFILFKLTESIPDLPSWLKYFSMLIPVFSALRLAKFNIDTKQSDFFIGLPTPANAIFFAGITLSDAASNYFVNPLVLAILPFASSFLLVSPLRLFSLKFKSLILQGNENRYLFLFFTFILLAFLGLSAIPYIILLYVAFPLAVIKSES